MNWTIFWTWTEQILIWVLCAWLIFRIVFTTYLGAKRDYVVQRDAIDEYRLEELEDEKKIFSSRDKEES